MEHLLMVVQERNRAHAELEYGEFIGPKEVTTVDALGREVSVLTSEHLEPGLVSQEVLSNEAYWSDKTVHLLRLSREKSIRVRRERKRRERYASYMERWNKIDYLDKNSVE